MITFLFADEVAVIDEIQMIRDPARGWAWTRALLGWCLNSIKPALCGICTEIWLFHPAR
jgi:hypothetical protein